MGRVYDIDPKPGERYAGDHRLYTVYGDKIPWAYRVEFDDDADEGKATVFSRFPMKDGSILTDCDTGGPCAAILRVWVRIVRKGDPAPESLDEEISPDLVVG